MGKIITIIVNTFTTIFWILCGGFRNISWSLTRKYGIAVAVLPEKKLRGLTAAGAPTAFGGIILLSDYMTDDSSAMIRFTILHEKAHCRKWRAMPGLDVFLKSKGHGRKTAAYEYAADQYAAEHGEVEGGIEMLTVCHEAGKDPEIRKQILDSGADLRDPIRRIRALKRWIARHQ